MPLRLALAVLVALPVFAQIGSTTLEVNLRDPQGALASGCIELTNSGKNYYLKKCILAGQTFRAAGLPPGTYGLVANSDGFEPQNSTVRVQAGEHKTLGIPLSITKLHTEIRVESPSTLLDPSGASGQRLSTVTVASLPVATPGRSVLQAVQTQPGWLLEANGVLHPRGSEYDTLYVIDGLPITSNRSPGFAPGASLAPIESVEMITSGYPAEYGRHLGGVVDVTMAEARTPGFHGDLNFGEASFHTTDGSASLGFGGKQTGVFIALDGFSTERYLDPPAEQNFNNGAVGRNISARLDHEFGSDQSLRIWFTNGATNLNVPNEFVQQIAGQRQDLHLGEFSGYVSYDRSLSSSSLLSARFMQREGDATLTSNETSTPIRPEQDRDLGEAYLSMSVSTRGHGHQFKAGGQFSRTHIEERFGFTISDPSAFDRDVPTQFEFSGAHTGNTEAIFVQNRFQHGGWTISAGLRWDRYSLLVQDSGISPRLSLAYHSTPLRMVLHASYDHVLEGPPIENLLLASSASVLRLGSEVSHLPIPLSRGDFAEAGVAGLLSSFIRLDANAFLRNTRNFVDDDLLLNTGVTLPTAFARASVYGAELKLEVLHWSRFSGFASYSYLLGRSITPVTGGLFLGDDADTLLQPGRVFSISQDQRNTGYGILRYEFTRSLWAATSFSYGSGLPTEIDPELTREELIAQSSPQIVEQIDLQHGRVKPNHSLDLAMGWLFWQRDHSRARVQVDVTNVTNKLNVIDFAGLFSGTALARPRAASVHLGYSF